MHVLTYSDVPFATSAFGEHTIIGTIGVINGVLNGVSQPFIAKVSLFHHHPTTAEPV
jgi:hypothetical protein